MRLFDFCFWLKCHIKAHRRRRCKRTEHYLWVSVDPRRLHMVSSKFCRRSRTFCTVLFLWDSGSVEQQHAEKKAHKTFRDKPKCFFLLFECLSLYFWGHFTDACAQQALALLFWFGWFVSGCGQVSSLQAHSRHVFASLGRHISLHGLLHHGNVLSLASKYHWEDVVWLQR